VFGNADVAAPALALFFPAEIVEVRDCLKCAVVDRNPFADPNVPDPLPQLPAALELLPFTGALNIAGRFAFGSMCNFAIDRDGRSSDCRWHSVVDYRPTSTPTKMSCIRQALQKR